MEIKLLKRIGFNFYDLLVKARNPKTNEVKMVDWFEGKVTIETNNCEDTWIVNSYSQEIQDFWLEKFGDIGFIFPMWEEYQFRKFLKETAKFVDAPYIKGCALTKEWIRYEIV